MNACRRVFGPIGLLIPARRAIRRTGAPAGFIDVVAALDLIGAADVEPAARWSVTFAVNLTA